jgi:WD40 repeat protein
MSSAATMAGVVRLAWGIAGLIFSMRHKQKSRPSKNVARIESSHGICACTQVGQRSIVSCVQDPHCDFTFVKWTVGGDGIITSGPDGTLRVWHHRARHQFTSLVGHTRQVLAVATMSDGSVIASASADGTLRTWLLPACCAHQVFSAVGMRLQAVAFAESGGFIFGGSSEGEVLWWKMGADNVCGRMDVGPGGITSIATLPTTPEVAISTAFGFVVLLDALTMSILAATQPGETDFVAAVAFRPLLPDLDSFVQRTGMERSTSWTELDSDESNASVDADDELGDGMEDVA